MVRGRSRIDNTSAIECDHEGCPTVFDNYQRSPEDSSNGWLVQGHGPQRYTSVYCPEHAGEHE